MCSKRDYREIVEFRIIPDPAENLGSIHFGKRNVKDDDIRSMLPEPLYRFNSAGELHNFVLVLQNRSDDQTIIRIVVHDGNFAHSRTNDIT